MTLKHKRTELMGLMGAIGFVVALAGFVGGYMGVMQTVFWTFAVWIVGPMLVIVFTDAPPKS